MRCPFLLIISCLCLAPTAARADGVDDFVRSELKRQHIPGAWVMVLRDGEVVKRKGYGLANLEDQTPVTPETLMQTGSIGKMFTAAGVMLLVQEGKLKLTDSIATYFPGSPDWWKPITIHHLLSHTGGIPEYEGLEYSVDLKKEYTEDELIRFAQKMKPDFAPGDRWAYSNTDYLILGVLIHKLTGKFYADFLKEKVWAPNHMPTMRAMNDIEVIPHRAAGYDWDKDHWLNQDWVSASLNATADGTLYATPDDFIAWDKALDNYSVLPKELQELMWTPAKLNEESATTYGYAWVVDDRLGHRRVWHNGAWQGFTSSYMRFRDDHLSVAVFENCSSTNPDAIAMGIAARYIPSLSIESRKPIVGDPEDLKAAKQIVLDVFSGRQPTVQVAGLLLNVPRGLLDRAKSVGDQAGPLKTFDLVYRRDGADGYSVYRAAFQHRTLWLRLTQNPARAFTSLASY